MTNSRLRAVAGALHSINNMRGLNDTAKSKIFIFALKKSGLIGSPVWDDKPYDSYKIWEKPEVYLLHLNMILEAKGMDVSDLPAYTITQICELLGEEPEEGFKDWSISDINQRYGQRPEEVDYRALQREILDLKRRVDEIEEDHNRRLTIIENLLNRKNQ